MRVGRGEMHEVVKRALGHTEPFLFFFFFFFRSFPTDVLLSVA